MAAPTKLNKPLWNNITRLKLLTKADAPVRFILEKTPFDDIEDEKLAVEKDEYLVIGRILPNSEIYKDSAFRIEMKLTSRYPDEPPIVRFVTPVYHPNIESNGTFCHQLVSNSSRWKKGTTLVEVVKAVVKHFDEPDPDYAVNYDIGREFLNNREEFNRKAQAMVKEYPLSRE